MYVVMMVVIDLKFRFSWTQILCHLCCLLNLLDSLKRVLMTREKRILGLRILYQRTTFCLFHLSVISILF